MGKTTLPGHLWKDKGGKQYTLGLERPGVRNIHSVRTPGTLTYLLINAQALQRARRINASLLTSLLGKVA